MYTGMLHLHNLMRYVLVLLYIFQLIVVWKAYLGKGEWDSLKEKLTKFLVIAFDIQFLIGIILYLFVSPITKTAFSNFGGAMKDGVLRFFAVEHLIAMLAVIALAHIGKVNISRAGDNSAKLKSAVIYYTIAFVLMMLAIPWPFYSFGRGWF